MSASLLSIMESHSPVPVTLDPHGPHCGVCGNEGVRRDTVTDPLSASATNLGHCPRCDHRWTWRAAEPALDPPRPLRPAVRHTRRPLDHDRAA